MVHGIYFAAQCASFLVRVFFTTSLRSAVGTLQTVVRKVRITAAVVIVHPLSARATKRLAVQPPSFVPVVPQFIRDRCSRQLLGFFVPLL